MKFRRTRLIAAVLVLAGHLPGCAWNGDKELHYLGDAELQYYKETATQIDYPHNHEPIPDQVQFAGKPRTLLDRSKDEIWNMTLEEALHLAIANNEIIRSSNFAGAAGSGAFRSFRTSNITAAPDGAPSVYDPAIQESNVLFGGRGVEAALAAFDAQLTTSMVWGRNENAINNAFFGAGIGGGGILQQDTGAFRSQLAKQFAYGGQLSLNHNWDYNWNNSTSQLFPSAYTGIMQAQYRHPLLAGAGPEFTRIAGPIAQSFGGITGVSAGVTIARINNDITLADFEIQVRDMLRDVEDLYWDLYLRYRNYDTAVTARNSALRSWREAKAKLDIGGVRNFKPADEAQARDQFFEIRALSESALSNLFTQETALRRMLGLSVNDGRIIRPADEPVIAEFTPDWRISLTEALTERVELRRQKWNIKSLELQLQASHSLTRPRLDFVSGYQVNGFGDKLISQGDRDGTTPQGFHSAYESITQGNQTGWNLGFEFNMPLGFRSAHAQVRNIELRLAKARRILAAQEIDISHELAAMFQGIAEGYVTAETNFNRRRAAQRRVELFDAEVRAGTKTLDELLRAQRSLADAEAQYYASLVNYNKAILALHYAKGTLLENNDVHLAEGGWTPEAYHEAWRRAWARSYAIRGKHISTEPRVFVEHGAISEVGLIPEESDNAPTPPAPIEPYESKEDLPNPVPAPAPPAEEAGVDTAGMLRETGNSPRAAMSDAQARIQDASLSTIRLAGSEVPGDRGDASFQEAAESSLIPAMREAESLLPASLPGDGARLADLFGDVPTEGEPAAAGSGTGGGLE